MDVDLTIRYSNERLCEIVASRPNSAAPLYRIVSRRADSAPKAAVVDVLILKAKARFQIGTLSDRCW